jgi:hypothetical protein
VRASDLPDQKEVRPTLPRTSLKGGGALAFSLDVTEVPAGTQAVTASFEANAENL